jgi:hypothetical protein
VREAAGYAKALARETPLFRNRTGKLRQSIRLVERSELEFRLIAGGPGVRYALFVERGTRAHWIPDSPFAIPGGVSSPSNPQPGRKLLRFVGSNGGIVFVRRVWHRGTSPRPFMQEARNDAEQAIVRFVDSHVGSALQGT